MLVWKKIIWLREQIAEQKKWIELCGGGLTGYIARYGDPGIPPLENGNPKILTIPANKQHLVRDLTPVPDTVDQFYAPHSGTGGTAIYEADYNRLRIWERELGDLQITNFSATQKANKMEVPVTEDEVRGILYDAGSILYNCGVSWTAYTGGTELWTKMKKLVKEKELQTPTEVALAYLDELKTRIEEQTGVHNAQTIHRS